MHIEVGIELEVKCINMDFVVVMFTCAHNIILGRPGIVGIGCLILMEDLCMKFHIPNGVSTMKRDQSVACKCYKKVCRKIEQVNTIGDDLKKRDLQKGSKPTVELEEIPLDFSR